MSLCGNNPNGVFATGTLLYMWDLSASPANWVAVTQLMDITGPQEKRAVVQTTTHDVPGGGTGNVQKRPGLVDSGQVSLSVMWDPNNVTHAGLAFTSLKAAMDDAVTRNWKIVYFGGSPVGVQVFCGFVNAYAVSAKVGQMLSGTVSIEVTGKSQILPAQNPASPSLY